MVFSVRTREENCDVATDTTIEFHMAIPLIFTLKPFYFCFLFPAPNLPAYFTHKELSHSLKYNFLF